MSLIEQLGGYEVVKQAAANYRNSGDILTSKKFERACREYRQQHNIFEENDKIVFVDDFMHDELMVVAWTRKGEVWMDDGAKRCTDLSMIRHAVKLPCVSVSTNRTLFPRLCSATAMLRVLVVLPVPPLRMAKTIVFIIWVLSVVPRMLLITCVLKYVNSFCLLLYVTLQISFINPTKEKTP